MRCITRYSALQLQSAGSAEPRNKQSGTCCLSRRQSYFFHLSAACSVPLFGVALLPHAVLHAQGAQLLESLSQDLLVAQAGGLLQAPAPVLSPFIGHLQAGSR